MSKSRARSNANRGLGRVLAYYIVMGAVTALLIRFPEFRDAISGVRLAELAVVDLFGPDAAAVGIQYLLSYYTYVRILARS